MRRFVLAVAFRVLPLAFLIGSTLLTHAATINVPAQQPTIQDGINAASSGDTVLVAPGTYFEQINFNGKAITVTSSGGPIVTIIDGSQTFGSTATFATGEKRKSMIAGFTLRNAAASQVTITGASPTIKGNIITGSQGNTADGMYISAGSPLIQGNLIAGNGGSGIHAMSDAGMNVIGNVIAGNFNSGINTQYAGGTDIIEQNTILGNVFDGLLYFPSSGNALIVQNLIFQNGEQGADVQVPFTMISNTIANDGTGGCCSGSELFIAGTGALTTVQNNLLIATEQSSAIYCQAALTGLVFTNNDAFSAQSSAYTGYCGDQTGVDGNISADPVFVDLLSDNFNIQSSSPAIGAGNASAPNEPNKDINGDPRFTNGTIDIGADEYSATTSLTLSSYEIHFPAQNVGTTSAPQSVTFTNNGQSPLAISMIASGPSFSQTNNCGSRLAVGASCEISVTFSPLTGSTVTSALGIFTNATLNPVAVTLLGTGVAAQINFCCSFFFFNQVIGTTTPQTGILTNGGVIPALISSIAYSGPSDFVESNNCPIAPSTLAVGASCSITVSYTPTIIGSESGAIIVSSNAAQLVIYVNGSSVSAGNPVLSPTSLTFPATLIGQSSPPQTATLTNMGTGPLGITGVVSSGDFSVTNNCPSSLAVNASCILSVTYTPSFGGPESGFVFVSNDSPFTSSLNLNGTGLAPVPTVSFLSPSSVPAGSTDAQVTINGTGFLYTSQVLWDGVLLNASTYSSGATQIAVTIPASYLTSAGTHQVSVFTAPPGGGTSNSLPFTIYTPVNYAEKSTTYSYRSITGTDLNLFYFGSAQLTSPFPIQFGGGSYTNLTIGAGGTISFNGFAYEFNDVIPTTEAPMLIAPFWALLYPFGGGTNNNVFWEVTGTAPNRELVVEWRNVGYCCETTNTIRFEVIFYEGSSDIRFNYADTIFGGSYSSNDNGATATSGVQVAPNLGTQFSYDQPLILSKTSLLWYPSNPNVTLSTTSLGFGYHQIGVASLPQNVTLTNGGQVPLAVSSISTDNPDYATTNTCGTTVAPGKSCTITTVFTPSVPEAETATLTIVDNATSSPQTVALTGIGSITPVVVYPILVNFGSVTVGSTATAPVTLANASNKTMTIQQITVSPSVFTNTNNCGSSVAPGSSCTITVTFTPTQKGSIQGALSLGLNGKPAKVVSNLTGSGS